MACSDGTENPEERVSNLIYTRLRLLLVGFVRSVVD